MVSDLACSESPVVQNRLSWFFSQRRGDLRDIQGTKRAAKALQQSAHGTPAQKVKSSGERIHNESLIAVRYGGFHDFRDRLSRPNQPKNTPSSSGPYHSISPRPAAIQSQRDMEVVHSLRPCHPALSD